MGKATRWIAWGEQKGSRTRLGEGDREGLRSLAAVFGCLTPGQETDELYEAEAGRCRNGASQLDGYWQRELTVELQSRRHETYRLVQESRMAEYTRLTGADLKPRRGLVLESITNGRVAI